MRTIINEKPHISFNLYFPESEKYLVILFFNQILNVVFLLDFKQFRCFTINRLYFSIYLFVKY